MVAQAVIDTLTPGGVPVGTIGSIVKRTPDAPLGPAQVPILEIKPVQNVHTRVFTALTMIDRGWLELTYRDAPLSQQQDADPTITLQTVEDRNWANRNAIVAALDGDPKLALGDDEHPAVSYCARQMEEMWHPDGPLDQWQGAEWVVWKARIDYIGPKQDLEPAPAVPGPPTPALLVDLLAYWNFDEGSGTSVADAVGPITGTWSGTLGGQWGPGIINDGGVFNGTDNLVDLGVQPLLTFAANAMFSVSLWVKPANVARSAASLMVNGLNGTCYNWRLAQVGAGLDFDNGVLAPIQLATGIFANGIWTHVVLTYAAGSLLAYINGVVRPLQAQVVTASCIGQSIKIGSSTTDTRIFDFFPGTLDEIGIWGRVLSQDDVTALYNTGMGKQYPFT